MLAEQSRLRVRLRLRVSVRVRLNFRVGVRVRVRFRTLNPKSKLARVLSYTWREVCPIET